MGLKRIKISELTLSDNLKGLYTIGVKLINGVQTSVKVSLEHIQTAYENAVAATKKLRQPPIVRTPQRVQPTVPLPLQTMRLRKQTRRRETLTRKLTGQRNRLTTRPKWETMEIGGNGMKLRKSMSIQVCSQKAACCTRHSA